MPDTHDILKILLMFSICNFLLDVFSCGLRNCLIFFSYKKPNHCFLIVVLWLPF